MSRMTRRIGKMRHRFSVHTVTRVADGAGGFTRTDPDYTTKAKTVWGSLRASSQNEIYVGVKLDQRITHVVVVRYDASITQGVSLVMGDRSFYVLSAVDPDERKEFMRIMCREGGEK